MKGVTARARRRICALTLASTAAASAFAPRTASAQSIPPADAAPPASSAPAPATPPPAAPAAEQGVTVSAERPLNSASSLTVTARELQNRPRTRPADVLEVAPGLIVVQHAGGGKANQYFLRGFDADHGTDVALSLDDVPINMVSHGHGQGYADPHFVIPELVDRVEVREGPYAAQDGDFATAGAINLRMRDRVDGHSASLEAGMYNSYRFLGIARTDVGPVYGYIAAEAAHSDGPFVHPLDFNHYNIVGRWSAHVGDDTTLSLTLMSYAGAWNASGQIPARLEGQEYEGRTFTRFDSVDPSEGGQSERHQAYLTLRSHPTPNSDLYLLAYAGAYRLSIYSNFTFFLNDPVHGDEIEQNDARTTLGYRAMYRATHHIGPLNLVSIVGTSLRYDSIDNGLHHDEARLRLSDTVVDHVNETALGLFAEEQIVPARFLRVILGLRGDQYDFAVEDRRSGITTPDPDRNGVRQAQLLSPKVSIALAALRTPSVDWDLYANFGRGFHSNDARGTVVNATPALTAQCADPLRVPPGVTCPVTPLTPATGYEFGTRMRLFHRAELSFAAWMLDLEHETVWGGDAGTTEVSGPTRRMGLSFGARGHILPWLSADVDVSLVRAVYRDQGADVGAVPLAPPWVVSAGLAARRTLGNGPHEHEVFAAVRLRAIGDRPADPQGTFTAQGFAIVNAAAGYRYRWFELGVTVENLLNSGWREAQFEEDSRLRNEPVDCPASNPSCHTDIKFTPGTPFAATARLTLYLDGEP